MIDNMTVTAAQEGLDFRFDLARPGNTFDAHRLLHIALEHSQQDELKERLDAARFTEGSPASDHFALRALATEVGLPEIEVDAVLSSDRYSDAVRADEAQARANGISAVHFFVIDGARAEPAGGCPPGPRARRAPLGMPPAPIPAPVESVSRPAGRRLRQMWGRLGRGRPVSAGWRTIRSQGAARRPGTGG
jgi:hypothetical protein